MTASAEARGCLLCEMEQAAPGAVVFRDERAGAPVLAGPHAEARAAQ
ncbi:MAG TPA: hypothetical protein VFQ68_06035 [Streptosporangiaceae bacterium]|nr:hypothetical protein [Streptosporangiaceae bacterium]